MKKKIIKAMIFLCIAFIAIQEANAALHKLKIV